MIRKTITMCKNVSLTQAAVCPFYYGEVGVCGASFFLMVTDTMRQQSFCLDTDRCDDRPMFLGSVLRPN